MNGIFEESSEYIHKKIILLANLQEKETFDKLKQKLQEHLGMNYVRNCGKKNKEGIAVEIQGRRYKMKNLR